MPETVYLTPNWNLIPHSKATNSYELFEELVTVADEEPLRIEMRNFQYKCLPEYNEAILEGPACGMVGCIGGWIFNLTVSRKLFGEFWSNEKIEVYAYSKLPPVCHEDAKRLFWGQYTTEKYRIDNGHEYPFPNGTLYGTREYADLVIQNIRKFMTKWEIDLKANTLIPVTE